LIGARVKGQPVLIRRRSIAAAAGLRTRQPRAFRRSAGQHVWAATVWAQRYQRRAELGCSCWPGR